MYLNRSMLELTGRAHRLWFVSASSLHLLLPLWILRMKQMLLAVIKRRNVQLLVDTLLHLLVCGCRETDQDQINSIVAQNVHRMKLRFCKLNVQTYRHKQRFMTIARGWVLQCSDGNLELWHKMAAFRRCAFVAESVNGEKWQNLSRQSHENPLLSLTYCTNPKGQCNVF